MYRRLSKSVDLIIALLIGILLFTLVIDVPPYDDTDDVDNKVRSGMYHYVDHGTGCEYIRAGIFGDMIPRVDADGQHICDRVLP